MEPTAEYFLHKTLSFVVMFKRSVMMDYHKVEYADEYVIMTGEHKGQVFYCKAYNLIKLPDNIDINSVNVETLRILYGAN